MPRFSNRIFSKRKNVGKKSSKMALQNDESENSTDTESTRDAPAPVSSSFAKIGSPYCVKDKYNMFSSETNDVNHVMNIECLSNALQEFAICKSCKSGKITVKEKMLMCGLAFKFALCCNNCKAEVEFYNSKFNIHTEAKKEKVFDVNVRLVYGFRVIGKGRTAANMLCGVMNLPQPPTKYRLYNKRLGEAAKEQATLSMKYAVEEAVGISGCKELAVAFDGTWQKRGHCSLNGVVTATAVDTGKAIDVAVLSKFCNCFRDTLQSDLHKYECLSNFIGSSGAMEIAGAKEIFFRSMPQYNVKYTEYLGDGDSKAYKSVVESEPYGPNVTISKLECTGHVQKRMGSRLRRLKQTMKGKKLNDGKLLGGKKRLTDAVIDKLQLYYGLAIRRNTNCLKSMSQAVWATFFHEYSTDQNPQHGLCDKSWCMYLKAKEEGKMYVHKTRLPPAVLDEIKPIYKDLAHPDLLKKCLHGKTQNCNESLNSVIWERLPKSVFVHYNTLAFGVYDAICHFNMGNISKCNILQTMGIKPGRFMCKTMADCDRKRVTNADKALRSYSKRARQERRNNKRMHEEEQDENIDDPDYGAGMH